MISPIKHIQLIEGRNLPNFKITFDEDSIQHLILTGRNGSGKTYLLDEIRKYLKCFQERYFPQTHEGYERLNEIKRDLEELNDSNSIETVFAKNTLEDLAYKLNNDFLFYGNCYIDFNNKNLLEEKYLNSTFIIIYFSAKRDQIFGENKFSPNFKLKRTKDLFPENNIHFQDYLLSLVFGQLLYLKENNFEASRKFDDWFKNFSNILGLLVGPNYVKFEFSPLDYNFYIYENNKIPYTLNQLSGGYLSILNIVSEIILRMEYVNKFSLSFDVSGIILIDEIENHLHVELQKSILPFLTKLFPNIQFIVSTHSPFVLSSVSNAIVFDMETQSEIEDMSSYTYNAIVESYFDMAKYSNLLIEKLRNYKKLSLKEELTKSEIIEYNTLQTYFSEIPLIWAEELKAELLDIELSKINRS